MKPPPFTAEEKFWLEYEIKRLKHTRDVELSRIAEVLGLELNEALAMVLEDAGWHRWVTRGIDRWKDVAASNEILFLREAELHQQADVALKNVLRWARMNPGLLPEHLIREMEDHLKGIAPPHLVAKSSDE